MGEASKLLVVANDLIVLIFHVSQKLLQPMLEKPKWNTSAEQRHCYPHPSSVGSKTVVILLLTKPSRNSKSEFHFKKLFHFNILFQRRGLGVKSGTIFKTQYLKILEVGDEHKKSLKEYFFKVVTLILL